MRAVNRLIVVIVLSWYGGVVAADPPKANALTEQEIADGWISLFDGETTFGWKIEGDAKVENGRLLATNTGTDPLLRRDATVTSTTAFGPGELVVVLKPASGVVINVRWGSARKKPVSKSDGDYTVLMTQAVTEPPQPIQIVVPPGVSSDVASIRYRPANLKALFNTKDLTGWKLFDADSKNKQAKYEVTPAGELAVTGGPGDLQTEAKYDDFVLQARAKTRRPGMNSGFFFRCIEGQYQQGYEVQIQNSIKDDDRTKPLDYGTGAIYRRVPARKVVSTDGEWFTLTVIADGPQIATWVNGYQVVDWTDDRPRDPNPRRGLRTEAGHISIQGHGPPMTADIVFKSIAIAELKPKK